MQQGNINEECVGGEGREYVHAKHAGGSPSFEDYCTVDTDSLLTVGIPVVLEHGVKVFAAYLEDRLVHVDRFVLHHDREIAGLLVVKREAETVRHRRALLTTHTDRPPHHAGVRATGKHFM